MTAYPSDSPELKPSSLSSSSFFHPSSFPNHSLGLSFNSSSTNNNPTVGSFNANSLARMESTFCKNFVCCSIPLDDLHDLLEHFEQAHCSTSASSTARHDGGVMFEDEDEWNRELDDEVVRSSSDHESMDTDATEEEEPNQRNRNRASSKSTTLPSTPNSNYNQNHHNRTNDLMFANLVASFHDSLGIPPALLDGQYSANASSNPGGINPVNTTHKPNKHLHPHFAIQNEGQGPQFGCAASDLMILDDNNHASQRNRIKDGSNLKKRFSDRDWLQSNSQQLASKQLKSTPRSNVRIGADEKPFKCTVPGCEKAYKQQNGLKYHKAHGHSSERVLRVEEESKVFVCHDAVCGKRYKNVNGLRYHYQHTGPHGMVGLELLALGLHPNLQEQQQQQHPSIQIQDEHLNRLTVFQQTQFNSNPSSAECSRDSSPTQN